MRARGYSRRDFLIALGSGALGLGLGMASNLAGPALFGTGLRREAREGAKARGEPILLGMQAHVTGVGADYGFWYVRVAKAAVNLVNELGGIAGRPVELVVEDDKTDPAEGPRAVRRLVLERGADFIIGTLFSDVLLKSVPEARRLRTIYFANSEDYAVSAGEGNRYTFQIIGDVRSQVKSIARWLVENLGRRWALIFPDYAFGYYHREWATRYIEENGGVVKAKIPVPVLTQDFKPYIQRVPNDVDGVYHVVVGPNIFTFIRQLADSGIEAEKFGFIDSIENLDTDPVSDEIEGWWFWEALPRWIEGYDTAYHRLFRSEVGVTGDGRSLEDRRRVSCMSHMWSVWETVFTIKKIVEESGWESKDDNRAFIEYLEGLGEIDEGVAHPQGRKIFLGKNHQAIPQNFISQFRSGRLVVVEQIKPEEGVYEPEADYTREELGE